MTDNDRAAAADHSASLALVAADPRYHQLVLRRSRFTLLLTAIMLLVYFGYILVIAFDRDLLARPILGGTTSLGIPVGLGVILVAIILTGLYVRRANDEFDPLTAMIREDATQ